MAYAKALPVSDVPVGAVAKATVNGRELAIVNHGGAIVALDGVCTHEAGPLGEGTLDGDELVCPWHEGRYRVETGEASPETDWVTDIKAFPVKVQDGYIWVDV